VEIYLKAGGNLKAYLKPDIDDYTRKVVTEEGKSVKEILNDIGVNPSFVAFIYTDGKLGRLDYIPSNGQSITLQPPVSGG